MDAALHPTGYGHRVSCPVCNWSLVPTTHPLPEAEYQGTCTQCHSKVNFRPSTSLPVQLAINGKIWTVSGIHQAMSLSSFLRHVSLLSATKVVCREGGCGACVIAATIPHPSESRPHSAMAIHSCLQPVIACDGWKVETAEGIGNRREGLHSIQQRVVEKSATQCGYCTPGMVMNMYSLMKNATGPLRPEAVEDAFDGNICRCTGYRPILDAMKCCASDAADGAAVDIEDLNVKRPCRSLDRASCVKDGAADDSVTSASTLPIDLRDAMWQTPETLEELRLALACSSRTSVRLVAGNTAVGVFREDGPYDLFINIRHVHELQGYSVRDGALRIGASVSLSQVIAIMEVVSEMNTFGYLHTAVDHLKAVGNTPMRNVLDRVGKEECMSLLQFLETDMSRRVIVRIDFNGAEQTAKVKTYKVTPRAQNSNAVVNAGFRMSLDKNYQVLSQPSLVFGGLSSRFIHAHRTEAFLSHKPLLDNDTVQEALRILESELIVDYDPGLASTEVRRNLAVALLYKFILHVCGPALPVRLRSGGEDLVRHLSSGKQEYETDASSWLLGQPMPKIGADLQTSGEAEYAENVPSAPNQLYAQFVLTSQGNATIEAMDATDALSHRKWRRPLPRRSRSRIPTSSPASWPPKMASRERVSSRSSAKTSTMGMWKSVVCLPRDDGVDVHASTQWPDGVQTAVATVLGINCSDVHVEVKRLGGAFGGKISRNNPVAAACALACKMLNRPVRLKMSLQDNMAMLGGREPFYITYKVGTTVEGRLTAIDTSVYINGGCSQNESMETCISLFLDMGYNIPNWRIRVRSVKTNLPCMAYTRSPAVAQTTFFRETVLEHVAHELRKDPLAVKKLNLCGPNDKTAILKMPLDGFDQAAMVRHLETPADVEQRHLAVEKFNKQNRWKTRGLVAWWPATSPSCWMRTSTTCTSRCITRTARWPWPTAALKWVKESTPEWRSCALRSWRSRCPRSPFDPPPPWPIRIPASPQAA